MQCQLAVIAWSLRGSVSGPALQLHCKLAAHLLRGLAPHPATGINPSLCLLLICLPACVACLRACRVVDPKEQIRQLVGASLSIILEQHSGDAVVAALGRSLQANRAPKVKCAVMQSFAAAVTAPAAGSAAGEDQQQDAAVLPPLQLQHLTGSGLGSLLRGVLQLATDKNPDIRRAAAEAVAAAYHAGEAQLVLGIVHGLPPADCLAVQRAIAPAIQQRGCEAALASAAAPPQSSRAAGGASQPSGSLTSRRQSGEGLRQLAAQQQQPSRPESGSLTARNRQSSQAGSPAPVRQQQAASAAQLTPQPPSPFMWRGPSASPLSAAAQPADGLTTEQPPAAPQVVAAAGGAGLASQAGPQQLLEVPAADVSAELGPFDDVMAGQLQRLLAHLEQGLSSEALQGLSRLAHVLPAAAWPPCFDQVGRLGMACRKTTAALHMHAFRQSHVPAALGLIACWCACALLSLASCLPCPAGHYSAVRSPGQQQRGGSGCRPDADSRPCGGSAALPLPPRPAATAARLCGRAGGA